MPLQNYDHPVWGLTSELTAPAALEKPLVVTDYEVEGTRFGPDGQTIRGRWESVPGAAGHETVPGGKVWRVMIDGNGGDVWLQPNRPGGGKADPIDFNVMIVDARNVRITGLEAYVSDIRTVNGYHVDDGVGATQLVGFKNLRGDGSVFIEGADIDMNWGGARATFRTDAFSINSSGSSSNPLDHFVVQNSRITGISSDLKMPASHADAFHFQNNTFVDQFAAENVYGTTRFQFFQMNYSGNESAMTQGKIPSPPMHSRFYNTHVYSFKEEGKGGSVLFTNSNEARNYSEFMSLEFDDMYIYVGSRSGAAVAPQTIYDYRKGDGNLDFIDAYVNARSNIRQADGDIQPNMVSGEDELHIVHDLQRMPSVPVPAGAVGADYVSIWAQDGALLDRNSGSGSSTSVPRDPAPTPPEEDSSAPRPEDANSLDVDMGTLSYSASEVSVTLQIDGAARTFTATGSFVGPKNAAKNLAPVIDADPDLEAQSDARIITISSSKPLAFVALDEGGASAP